MKYKVLGLMSGTSLDGLDMAICEFEKIDNSLSDQKRYTTYSVTRCQPINLPQKKRKEWNFKIERATTIKYSENWIEKLKNAHKLSAYDFLKLDVDYGKLIGKKVNEFLKDEKVDFIASHGHTIFHNPAEGVTSQIGNGFDISAVTGLPVINNFRNFDVALGGQGAPLVPIGDKILFSQYDFCLNLGGFSNISFQKKNERIAFDISPVNFAANYFAKKLNFEIDEDGKIGEQGKFNKSLFNKLNNINFYKQKPPKSLGREWFFEEFLPVVENFEISTNDKLRTIYEHIAFQISKVTNQKSKTVLLTGGGAYNKFLINLLEKYSKPEFIIPKKEIIDYKEALIFAFLGVLHEENQENCLASVTGAKQNSVGGVKVIKL